MVERFAELYQRAIAQPVSGDLPLDMLYYGNPEIIRTAVEALQTGLTEEVKAQVRELYAQHGESWVDSSPWMHFSWGMGVRNLLRDKVGRDSELPSDNWDSYYIPLIEVALGLRKNPLDQVNATSVSV